jgi:hypothetical protein
MLESSGSGIVSSGGSCEHGNEISIRVRDAESDKMSEYYFPKMNSAHGAGVADSV